MPLNLAERRAVTREMRRRYRKADRAEKGRMLDELVELAGYNRSYAARLLRKSEYKYYPPPRKRGRKRVYGPEVYLVIRKVWATLDGACGKRIAAVMPEIVAALERHRELDLSRREREQVLSISAATIDRMLAPDRVKISHFGVSHTKPGSMLKAQIPVRTFADWDDQACGFLEIDLVSHDGGDARGEFCFTLDATCVATGWTETRAIKNKASKWVLDALKSIRSELPFEMLGIDSDNGSEFINTGLLRFCEQENITFTRTRPGRKNDNCKVEQKNWSVVRRNVGYARFNTAIELATLNQLYALLRLHTNFFIPSMRLLSKTRDGAKVSKVHDRPATPYARVLASPDVDEAAKESLRQRYLELNPAQLKREIVAKQRRLIELTSLKERMHRKEVEASGLEYINCEATKDLLEYLSI